MTNAFIEDLKIWGVYDPGIPNMERIVIRVVNELNTSWYGLIIGLRGTNNSAIPLRDNFFWFGNAVLKPGDWIYVYTAPGESKIEDLPNTTDKLYSLHWDKKQTVFQNVHLMPVLIKMEAVQFPENLPLLANGQEAGT